MGRPKTVSSVSWSPPFPWPTHTLLPIPFPIGGRDYMLVADEDALPKGPGPGPYLWLVDITDLAHPVPISTFDVPKQGPVPTHSGLHQPAEDVRGTVIPVAWHAAGVRLIDFSNPHAMKEVGCFVPPVPEGAKKVQTNDVCWDDRGLIYIIDRARGMHILERV